MTSIHEQQSQPDFAISQAPIAEVLSEIACFDDYTAMWGVTPTEGGHILHENKETPFYVVHTDRRKTGGVLVGTDITVFDIEHGQAVGYGTVSSYRPGASNGLPYVGYTETLGGNEKEGWGTRRLRLMNALSRNYFNLPLYSSLESDGTNKLASPLWERLTQAGEAEEVTIHGRQGWRFL